MTDAETGQRGYLLTEDPEYLAPYLLAITSVEVSHKRLLSLTSDNLIQTKRLEKIEILMKKKFEELKITISLIKTGNWKLETGKRHLI